MNVKTRLAVVIVVMAIISAAFTASLLLFGKDVADVENRQLVPLQNSFTHVKDARSLTLEVALQNANIMQSFPLGNRSLLRAAVNAGRDLRLRREEELRVLASQTVRTGNADVIASFDETVAAIRADDASFEQLAPKLLAAETAEQRQGLMPQLAEVNAAQVDVSAKLARFTTAELNLFTVALARLRQVRILWRTVSIVLFILALAGYFFIIWYAQREVIQPIASISAKVENISKGDIAATISPTLLQRDDELGRLARAFERTFISLKLAMNAQGGDENGKKK